MYLVHSSGSIVLVCSAAELPEGVKNASCVKEPFMVRGIDTKLGGVVYILHLQYHPVSLGGSWA